MITSPYIVFNPFDWYWLADDKRVYASKIQMVTTDTDVGYQNFVAAGYVPYVWPRDSAGNQTNAALQAEIAQYGLFVDLKAYSANQRYKRASGGIVVTSISPVPFLTDPTSRNTVNSAWDYLNALGGTQTINWKMTDSSFIVLTEANLNKLLNTMSSFVQSCFTCESNTAASIDSGTINTRAQVDAAYAAIPNVYA